jgi:nucleosome assembly protein 1-like 1
MLAKINGGGGGGMIFPPDVKRRVGALRKLHESHIALENEYQREIRLLSKKYEALYAPLYDKRREIVVGSYEPKDDEILEEEDGPATVEEVKDGEEADQKHKGIPDFWVQALTQHPMIQQICTPEDEEALEALEDIRATAEDPNTPGFTLTFTFGENPYFSDRTLTKSFIIGVAKNGEHEIKGVRSTKPKWNAGKNLTVQIVTKKQKHKTKGVRTITKEEPKKSFFNFFDSPTDEAIANEDEEAMESVEQDYEIADILREMIIPQAVLWFTGEAEDNNFMGGEDDFDDEEQDEDDDDEDDDEDDEPPQRKGGKGKGHAGQGKPGQAAAQPECKQS